ncbi:MAG: GntR family transcriptional regulator [Desulfosarcinaceae bacterium]|nr:GntR family transcriptional regulator [Desulfosarcinaceae bacterium]
MLTSAPDDHPGFQPTIEIRSLRQQVYDYLRAQMHAGHLLPGSFIKLKEISERLGISKTPLRDALIQLECEGFVTILPRRGVLVNKLTIDDIRNVLEILGALESAVVYSVFARFEARHIDHMKRLNQEMRSAIDEDRYDDYYKLNIDFHDVFLNLSDNTTLHRIVMPFKQRLYDFPRRSYIEEWELINCDEHDRFIAHIEQGERDQATDLMKNSHWSFAAYEKFIRQFYFGSKERIEAELAWRK